MKKYILLSVANIAAGAIMGAIAGISFIKYTGKRKLKKRVTTVQMNPDLMKEIAELYSLLYEYESSEQEGHA